MTLPCEPCRVTSGFRLPVRPAHNGIDIVGKLAAATAADKIAVKAVMGGVVGASTLVTTKADKTWEWGNYVRIDLPSGEKHYYCHLAARAVQVGQTVNAGDLLGIMGSTGKSYGIHLHFEVRNKKGISVNPCPALGILNKAGVYYSANAIYKNTPKEEPALKLKIVSPMNGSVSSRQLDEGVIAVQCADGVLRGYNPGGARIARTYSPATLSQVFESLRGELLPGEIIVAEK